MYLWYEEMMMKVRIMVTAEDCYSLEFTEMRWRPTKMGSFQAGVVEGS